MTKKQITENNQAAIDVLNNQLYADFDFDEYCESNIDGLSEIIETENAKDVDIEIHIKVEKIDGEIMYIIDNIDYKEHGEWQNAWISSI